MGMVKRYKSKLYTLISILLIAFCIIGCSGESSSKDSEGTLQFTNPVEKGINTLKYKVPSDWVNIDSEEDSPVDKSQYNAFHAYGKVNKDGEYLALLYVYYLGDNTISLHLEGDTLVPIEDRTKTIRVGLTNLTVETYKNKQKNSVYLYSYLYSSLFVLDDSTFMVVLDSPKGENEDFFIEFLQNIDFDNYRNPRATESQDEDDNDSDTPESEEPEQKPVKIKAKYNGNTDEDTVISKNDITVTVTYDNGDKDSVTDFDIEGRTTLKAGKTSTVTIKYEGLKCKLKVKCTSATFGQRNALERAKQYLNTSAFSRKRLIEQLEYEGYTSDEAEYAVKNCGADWKEQAVKRATEYLNTSAFSKKGLYEQLIYEGFSEEQAQHGVDEAYK